MKEREWTISPSFGDRLEIDVRLVTLTGMHISSGLSEPQACLRDEKSAKDPEAGMLVRDAAGAIVLPATSLKGAMRANAVLSGSEKDQLFGKQGAQVANRPVGQSGRLWFTNAAARLSAQDFAGLTKNDAAFEGGYFRTGVAIDRRTGAADDHKLFNKEILGDGAVFDVKLLLFTMDGDGQSLEPQLIDQVKRALAPLLHEEGISIGADGRKGQGRVRVKTEDSDAIRVKRWTFDASKLALAGENDKELADELTAASRQLARGERTRFSLRLHCPGPFISMRERRDTEATSSSSEARQRTVSLIWDGQPHLWPSSFLGALRQRAAWIAECERLRNPELHLFEPAERGAGVAIDDRDLEQVLPQTRAVHRVSDVAKLSSVERLFGVPGWRGLISVVSLECISTEHRTVSHKSVKIDRFTGGGVDGALFQEDVFYGAEFSIELALDHGRQINLQPALRTEEQDLLAKLRADLEANGLMLGHGASKGFGWFDLPRALRDARAGGLWRAAFWPCWFSAAMKRLLTNWRRERDSNPRGVAPNTLSRRAP